MMHALQAQLRRIDPVLRIGRVRRIWLTHIEADGPCVQLGTLCSVEGRTGEGRTAFDAEVVRIDRDSIVLSPLSEDAPTFSGARVTAVASHGDVTVGHALLGRAVDPMGRPIDGGDPIYASAHHPLHGVGLSPLARVSPDAVFETGIRVVDGLLTLGKGQRVGVFAASGVGKTSLMTQIVQQASADIRIVCLVGERGREVEGIWNGLDEAARAGTTLVAATSDQSAALRVRAGHYALALAEYWRGEGKHVLLVLDSVTRLAMAMREIGLAAGEPPTVRAYTPNVFAMIPKMIERCGAIRAGGAITAIMTVLSETDEVDDPVCELMKSLLDGHVVLSRALAEQGHFPAIDVLRSVSRQAEALAGTSRPHAAQVLEWLSAEETSRTLVDTGLYKKGSNERIDRAFERYPEIVKFLRQGRRQRTSLGATMTSLESLALVPMR